MANTSHAKPGRLLKFLILGDKRVGKTAITRRYVRGYFRNNTCCTPGADFLYKEVELDGERIKLQVWDLLWYGGMEALSRMYCRHTDVCILVYDVTNPRSLEQLAQLKSIYEQHRASMGDVGDHTVYAVFANKIDLEEGEKKRAIKEADGEAWCRENGGMQHFSMSAKTGENVDQAFTTLIAQAKRKIDARNAEQHDDGDDETISLHDEPVNENTCVTC